jgi:plastocyanin
MAKFFVRPVHSWFLIGAFMTLMLVLSACGGSGGNTGTSGSGASSGSGGTTNVSIDEKKTAGQADQYYFTPSSITIKKGTTVAIQNNSDELQDCDQGDAQKAGVDSAIPVNQTGHMTFNTTGTFTIKSEKGAALTVTVQ